MSDDDMEDYGFEYSDEEYEEEDVDIENQYYNSKGLLESDDLNDALKGFEQVVTMEQGQGEWGFKALKQVVKLHFKMGNTKAMLESYREMLTYIKSAVTRNASEKKINSLLDHVSAATSDLKLLQEFYQITLDAMAEAKNDRLWFKANLKLATLFLNARECGKALRLLKDLHKSCRTEDGSDDLKKGTQLLEVYALEIQVYTEQKNTKRLKQLYKSALAIKSAIPHPRIMGVIRECGGKMHMHERVWSEAATDFFEAFKSYDEAGSMCRIRCLKYLVLANMLMQSNVDPFDAQEAKPYKADPEVVAMTNLVAAYQDNNINEFERVLRTNRGTILSDPFIQQYIEDLLKNIRTQVVLKVIQPYTRVRIPFISQQLNIPEADVQQLLVSLILDGKVAGTIDQVKQLLEVGERDGSAKGSSEAAADVPRHQAIDKWAKQLKVLHNSVLAKLT